MFMSVEELHKYIRRGPGLVIGPELSTSSSREAECLNLLQSQFPLDLTRQVASYLDYVDLALADSRYSEVPLRNTIESFFQDTAVANPQLYSLTKANWTAVVSLCSDDLCRQKLSDHIYSAPTKWSVTTVAAPGSSLPLRTTPYYCLLGDPRDSRHDSKLAVSTSQYLRRQRSWLTLLGSLPDVLKADPLMFLGTSGIASRVCAFMNELLKLAPRIPKRLIFLDTDETAKDAIFRNLVADSCEIITASGTISDIGNFLSRENISIRSLPLFAAPTKGPIDSKALYEMEEQLGYVPRADELDPNRTERNRLLDSLFRPTYLDWTPYVLKLEFQREISSAIVARVEALFSQASSTKLLHLKGEAGVGKTVALRSAAFALAQQNCLCFWIKKSYAGSSLETFDRMVTKLNESLRKKDTRVVFFLDDPIATALRPDQVIAALARSQFPWVLVACSRKTDTLFS